MSYYPTLLFTQPNIGGFVFQTTFNIEETIEAVVTTNPVEFGANITDTAYINPVVVSIEGYVGSVQFLGILPYYSPSSPGDALYQLRQLQVARTPLTVTTNLSLYQNMLIQNIQAGTKKESPDMLWCTLTLQQINVINAEGQSINTNPSDPHYGQAVNNGIKQGLPT